MKNWFSNSEPKTAGGKLEFIQQSEYDLTNVEVNLEGLSKLSSGYHIHMVGIEFLRTTKKLISLLPIPVLSEFLIHILFTL